MIWLKTEAEPGAKSRVQILGVCPLWIPISASTLLCHNLSIINLQYTTELLTLAM